MNKKILIVDDEELVRITLQDILSGEGYEVEAAADGVQGWEKFREGGFMLVLADLKMPGMGGEDLLKRIKEASPDTIVFMLTAYGTISSAVKCMKLGAFDYLSKPFLPEDIVLMVKKAIEYYCLKQENRLLREKLKGKWRLEGFIGRNEKIQNIYRVIESVSKAPATILIRGETGTGKELVAEAIHNLSDRKNKPLVRVSCAGLPETLLESELFGHEKGAFTDALGRKIGRFEMADGGTLFLDDVDDISMSVQVKLLRVLQEREIERLGSSEPVSVDIRVVAATKKNLLDMVKEGKFRDDLYYRLNVVTLDIPPLRERRDDIPLLAECFIERYGGIYNKKVSMGEEALSLLSRCDWPGNVRELENFIEKLIAVSDKPEISAEDIIPYKLEETGEASNPSGHLGDVLKEKEKEQIINVLARTGGKKAEAAKILGISRKTLWQKLKEYSIEGR